MTRIAATFDVFQLVEEEYLEYRKSRIDKGYKTYVRTLLSVVDLEKLFIEHPELQRLWTHDPTYQALSEPDRKVFHWCTLLINLFEVVFLASPLHRRWMSDAEWEGWSHYITPYMATSEAFRQAWQSNRAFYSHTYRRFMDAMYDNATKNRNDRAPV